MASSPDRHARAMLPIPDRPAPGLTTYDAKDPATSYPPIEPLLPPGGAPNVLVVLLDDVGFGAASAFGGPCRTPTAERLAAGGLRYNRFHTTALCAPTRQALLTGRNHHSVGMGSITETATTAPGYSSLRPNTKAPLAMTLKLNGYSTAEFGKCQFLPGMGRLSENSVVSIKNKSFSVTAELDIPEGGADGVIIAQGGRFGGWAVYAKDGTAKFVYNVLGIREFVTEATSAIPAGTHQVRMEFAYDGGGLAKGGTVTLYHDGTEVGRGRVEATQPMIFSADETTDIGYESGTTVTADYTPHTSRFTGKINWVQIDLGHDDHDHFIDPEERLRIAMARQ